MSQRTGSGPHAAHWLNLRIEIKWYQWRTKIENFLPNWPSSINES